MEFYFIKSVACLAILFVFYKLLLEKESMHQFKRFYLLGSILAAIVIPFLTITKYIEPSAESLNSVIIPPEAFSEVPAEETNYLTYFLLGIYCLGIIFFSAKFIRNLRVLLLKISKNPKVKRSGFINVLLSEKVQPHTFFSFIFFNREKYLNNQIPEDVKIHEETHASQKHSLDIIFIELLQIIFWINPFIFMLKKAIKLNHEFLADRAVINRGISTSGYQQTLLSFSSGDLQSELVNPINYSSIKKRFTVMKTKTSKTAVWARSLLLLPLLAVLVYGFSTNEVVVKAQDQKQNIKSGETSDILISEDINVHIFKNGNITVNHQTVKLNGLEERLVKINRHLPIEKRKELTSAEIKVEPGVEMGIITDVKMLLLEYGVSQIEVSESARSSSDQEFKIGLKEELEKMKDLMVNYNHQEKATPEMVAEYNKLAAPHNSKPKGEAIIKKKDYERMKYIYGLMTPDQKKKAEAFPVPAPRPPLPNEAMIAEHNRLVKHYNSLSQQTAVVKQEDANRIMYIRSLMTPEEKQQAEKIRFEIPPPPPPATAPQPAKGKSSSDPLEPVEVIGYPAPPAPPTTILVDSISPPPPPSVTGIQPPPPPPPVTFEELVKDGATFYYNGKLIAPEKARNLVEVQKTVNVEIRSMNDEKPVVKLTDKKNKK